MARFLAIDWDNSEVRFLLGMTAGDQLTVLKTGSAPISVADVVSEEETDVVEDEASPEENHEPDEGETGDDSPPSEETKEKKSVSPSNDQKSVELGRTLKKLLREDGIHGGNLILCLPRDRAEVLYLNLPKLAEAELPDIVRNQVLRDSSTYMEGHPLDFIPLGLGDQAGGQKILSASITRVELRHLRTICSTAGRKPARIELRLTALCEFVRAGKIVIDEPTLLVQEGVDEINFIVFHQNRPIYLRAFQIQPGLPVEEREERLKTEILRTLRIGSDGEPIQNVTLFGGADDYARLMEDLNGEEIKVERVDPFILSGVKVGRGVSGEHVPLYAPLLGSLLAERGKKSRPLLDLLHPRQKPKPPNYALYFVALFLVLAIAAGLLWRWNRNDLAKKQGEVERLQKELATLQNEYNALLPQFTILDNARQWDQFGVNVLDELRDILQRIPSSPDLLVSRLAYNGLDPQFGRPVFIINAKVTNPAIYQRFYQRLTADESHSVNSRGVQQSRAASANETLDYEYSFTAVILCRRRAANEYLKNLPPEIREISNNKPEFYDRQTNPQKNGGRTANPQNNQKPNKKPDQKSDQKNNAAPQKNAPVNQGGNPS